MGIRGVFAWGSQLSDMAAQQWFQIDEQLEIDGS